ncbi:protein of unknown function [Methylocaldum szegediense]|uniref:Uncharacterized protein n=1 Tax=Methylocaldum szegediense TaxID=73780 RepID=A0ABN8WWL5_9GAMM|nr:protein of unknown function [Methylocaldum szegediense]
MDFGNIRIALSAAAFPHPNPSPRGGAAKLLLPLGDGLGIRVWRFSGGIQLLDIGSIHRGVLHAIPGIHIGSVERNPRHAPGH